MATITGTNGVDTLFGTGTDDLIFALGGNDTVYAGSANDTVYGGAGNDYIYGEDGNDVLYGEANTDRLFGGNGNDYLYGGDGTDYLQGSFGNDYLDGGTGLDIARYESAASGIVVNLLLGTASDGDGGTDTIVNVEGVAGSSYADMIIGNNANGSFEGGAGNDTIYGGGGNDTVSGGYSVGSGNDFLYGEAGNDQLLAHDGNDFLDGGADTDTATYLNVGGDLGFVINLVTGSATNGVNLHTMVSIENIKASDRNDIVTGDANDNVIELYNGDDIVNGGDGLDTLSGGIGSDTFVFEAASAFNDIDVIWDFTVAQNDKLDLSDLLSAYDPLTDIITDFIEITTAGANSVLKVDMDGAGISFAMAQIAQLTNATGLTDEAALVSNGNIVV